MTTALLNSINTKDRLYKIMIQSDWQDITFYNELNSQYKRYRAVLRKSIREAKRLYHIRMFDTFKNDIKKTWSFINNSLNRNKKKNNSTEFNVNDQTITDENHIAEEFNNYFINIGNKLAEKIMATKNFNASTLFHFHPIEEKETLRIIQNLKNKSSFGHDSISNKLLKRSQEVLYKPLTMLINQTIATGYFPEELKLSWVKPLYKNGDSTLISNYRPISLLPSLSKVYERVIFDQLFQYMSNNNLLNISQYGFRPGHSTELAALELMDRLCKDMDQGLIPANIYIDLSKAFDTLVHEILLKKLAYYGVVGIAQTLFKEYLTERFQYVQFNDSCSSKKNIKTGVPQGSILGPLLFLIYINDLPEISRHIKMVMYADDTTLYCNLGDLSEDIINTELTKVSEWLAANKLSLNVKKTKCMVFHTPQRKVTYPEIKINNILIERVSEFNFLGITFNSNLKWHTHINYITKKVT